MIDYEEQFQWVYGTDRLPVKAIIKEMRKIARAVDSPSNGDMAIISGGLHRLSVGVVVDNGILTIAHGTKSFWTASLSHASFYSSLQ